ncbi:hypothetical protein STRPO_1665 [Streptococcus porcinus str. Jelinkova 176]|uniref:Degenerate transposase n=3 Tax=Streptococcus porcinus TaxID=1340 RepID=A0A4V0GYL3_STRPO|nr:IS30 family transposase [Streptococcus porcinus]EGJ26675.1 hypothetical protein STRPO_1665 [Streptococcus porcinus str. Jelinkova 176]SQG42712.1 degenerate transposase [Streptococcus porcinus]VTT41731.1 degenerate transposase [Streptococcus porcinus]VTT42871.1 degenerate transposase [Streptococcus porcinus]
MKRYPIKAIMADSGSEFTLLGELKGVDIYFADSYSSHERGNNANFNGLLREFVPKEVSLNDLSQGDLAIFTQAINDRIRRIPNYQTA